MNFLSLLTKSKLLPGILMAVFLFGAGWFVRGKTIKKPTPIPKEAVIAQSAPAIHDTTTITRWEAPNGLNPALLEGAMAQVDSLTEECKEAWRRGFEAGFDTCALGHHSQPPAFAEFTAQAHTKDLVKYFFAGDSIQLIHSGLLALPVISPNGQSSDRPPKSHRPILEFGLIRVFRDPTAFGTIPLPRERRMFYMPQRAGVSYRFKGKELDLAISWSL